MKTFSLSLPENEEWITEKCNRVQNINLKQDIENQKVEGFITYSIDQQILKFRAIIGHEDPLKTTDPNWKGSKFNLD